MIAQKLQGILIGAVLTAGGAGGYALIDNIGAPSTQQANIDAEAPGPEVIVVTATPVPPAPSQPPAVLPDRFDCNAIRGTDYRSPAERNWFIANCSAPTPPPPPAQAPPQPPAAVPTIAPAANCHPSYSVCLRVSPDIDCGEISARRFRVIGPDTHRLDADNDGIACES